MDRNDDRGVGTLLYNSNALYVTINLFRPQGTIKFGGSTMDEVNLDTIIEQYRSTNNYTAGIHSFIPKIYNCNE